jgi:phosphocarrier protein
MKDTPLAGEDDWSPDLAAIPPDAIVQAMKIVNPKGLHARASARFVQTVEKFDVDVRVGRGNEFVGGTSIMGLMMLAAGPGTEIIVVASGKEKMEVLAALETLVNSGFGEVD